MQQAIAVYSSDELDVDQGSGGDNNVHLKNWLEEGRAQARPGARGSALPLRARRGPTRGRAVSALLLRTRRQPERAGRNRGAARVVLQGHRHASFGPSPPSHRTSRRPATPKPSASALQQEVDFYGDLRAAIKRHSGEELDIKPYEADMRHLLKHLRAGRPRRGTRRAWRHVPLTELIVQNGHPRRHRSEAQRQGHAIEKRGRRNHHQQRPQDRHQGAAHRPPVLRADVRTSRRPHQAEPGRCRGVRAVSEGCRGAGQAPGRAPARCGPACRACTATTQRLWSSTTCPESWRLLVLAGRPCPGSLTGPRGPAPALALEIDKTMRERAPAGWKGDPPREAQVLNALFPLMDRNRDADVGAVRPRQEPAGSTDGGRRFGSAMSPSP